MNKIKELLKELSKMCTISGTEAQSKLRLLEIASGLFDDAYEDSLGDLVLVVRSGKENAPRLMIDAHFDEVGMLTSGEGERGFYPLIPIGGIDTRVLGATRVIAYGKEQISGVLTSTPPHLLKDKGSLPKMSDIYLDTGNFEVKLPIGTPVGYAPHYTELLNNRVSAKGLDDKACVCAMLNMASKIDKSRLMYDIYIVISAQEEVGKGGARFIAYDIAPDIAIITDVGFARAEGIEVADSVLLGEGAYIDFSACTDIMLTRKIVAMCKERGICHQVLCEPSRTHTNNEAVSIAGAGVRTALLGVALDGMHTPSEIVSLDDIKSLSSILLEIAYTPKEQL